MEMIDARVGACVVPQAVVCCNNHPDFLVSMVVEIEFPEPLAEVADVDLGDKNMVP